MSLNDLGAIGDVGALGDVGVLGRRFPWCHR